MITIYELICPGRDFSTGVEEACRKGYKVVPYPGKYGREEVEKAKFYWNLERLSVIEMLENTPLKNGGESVLFGEADFVPQISSEELEKVIARAPGDWELLTFAWNLKEQEVGEIEVGEEVEWAPRSRIVGTQALMFRNREVVEKMKRCWEKYVYGGIDMATQTSRLKQYATKQYCIRQSHVNNFEEMERPRDRRFLVCMNSYRRLKDAIRQVYTFMDQSYSNFIFQLLLHGVSEYDWKRCFEPNLSHFIREGRLVVQCGPNRNQLSNVARYGEGVNPDAYDLVVKVDDDDWYDRDYLKRLNYVHQSFSLGVGSWQDLLSGSYSQWLGYPVVTPGLIHCFGGNQLVIPKSVIEVVKEYERSGRKKEVLIPIIGEEMGEKEWRWREDNLMVKLMVKMGMIDRTYLSPPPPGMLVNKVGGSVLRRSQYFSFYRGERSELITYLNSRGERKRILIQGGIGIGSGEGERWDVVADGDGIYFLRRDGKESLLERDGKEGIWKMSEI